MRTLVICVDRDDDIGVKTGTKGPVIGRDDNLSVATKLGLADPEDADVNTILTAVSIYDELIRNGREAEVATISGDVRVGTISDAILTGQLEQVIEETRPTNAFLVSDGAEDEYIFPMIGSRIKVDHVRRVFIRQSPALESTYYMIAKAMKNKKVQRRILFPIGLAILIFSALYVVNPLLASQFVAIAIGFYIIFLALGISGSPSEWAYKLNEAYERFKNNLVSGDVSIIFSIAALVFFLLAVLIGADAVQQNDTLVQMFVHFSAASLWWFVLSLLVFEIGRVATAYFTKGRVPKHVLVVASTFIAMGFVFFATLQSLSIWLGEETLQSNLWLIYVSTFIAILLVILGGMSYRSKEKKLVMEDTWRH